MQDDAGRRRVLCFDLATRKPLATFGQPDHAGTTRATLARPQTLAARARRAVLHDTTNQRLLKLRLP